MRKIIRFLLPLGLSLSLLACDDKGDDESGEDWKNRVADALGGGAPSLAGLPQQDMTVPAGTFLSCYRSQDKQQAFGVTADSTVWHPPAVPITTMVKMTTKGGSEWVPSGYGMTGAKATM